MHTWLTIEGCWSSYQWRGDHDSVPGYTNLEGTPALPDLKRDLTHHRLWMLQPFPPLPTTLTRQLRYFQLTQLLGRWWGIVSRHLNERGGCFTSWLERPANLGWLFRAIGGGVKVALDVSLEPLRGVEGHVTAIHEALVRAFLGNNGRWDSLWMQNNAQANNSNLLHVHTCINVANRLQTWSVCKQATGL